MAEILIFSPHPDDAELAMGGTIAKLCSQGVEVALIDVTSGEPTPHGSEAIRARETAEANQALGNPIRENLGLPNRWLEHTIENRKLFAAAIRRHRPRLVFIPYHEDAHPDHLAVHQLGLRARFDAKLTRTDIPGEPHYPQRIVEFYCTHLMINPQPTFLVDITGHTEAKEAAIRAYQSQFYEGRPRPGEITEHVLTMNRYFGWRSGVGSAEPYYCPEPIALGGPDAIL